MKRKSLTIVIVALIGVMILTVAGAALALPDVPDATPATDEVGKYLIIGMRPGPGSQAVTLGSSNEIGADRAVLSSIDSYDGSNPGVIEGSNTNVYPLISYSDGSLGPPANTPGQESSASNTTSLKSRALAPDSIRGVFIPAPDKLTDPNPLNFNRWLTGPATAGDGGAASSPEVDYLPYEYAPGDDRQARTLRNVDWSGNVAVTSDTGIFSLSDINVFADVGYESASAIAGDNISNSYFFADTSLAGVEMDEMDIGSGSGAEGPNPAKGWTGGVSFTQLFTDLQSWRTYIRAAAEEQSFDIDLVNQNHIDSDPYVYIVQDAWDTNADGVIVIEVDQDTDFEVNNSDWVIEATGNKLVIFRIRNQSNMNISNSSIMLGEQFVGAIGVDELGAIFVKAHPEEEFTSESGSSDTVFSMNNVVLNGVALWDLNTIDDAANDPLDGLPLQDDPGKSIDRSSQDNYTNISVGSNAQGCSQFISPVVTMQNVRWMRCALGEALVDWGDLPDSFDTTNTQSGPNHVIGSDLYLGSCVDAEDDGQPDDTPNPQAGAGGSGTGDGDDGNTGTSAIGSCDQDGDDEDGVTLVTPLIPGTQACVEIDAVNTGTDATLYGWIDFNGDGDFDGDADDYVIFTGGGTIANGGATDQQACFTVPAGATFAGGETHMRFRLTSDTLTSTDWGGAADDGEVEDYWQQLACMGNYVWDDSDGSSDHVQDGVDVNLSGVDVRLVWADGNGTIDTDASDATAQGDDLIYTTTTDGNGRYDFCGLVPGTYRAEVPTAPSSAMQAVKPDIGGDDEKDSDGVQSSPGGPVDGPDFTIPTPPTSLPTGESGNQDNPGGLNVPDEQDDLTFDFGWCEGASIKATVCEDLDLSGTCEPGEPPLQNVLMALIPQGATPGSPLVRVTDANGQVEGEQFQLGFAVPGDYMIQVQETYMKDGESLRPVGDWFYSFHIDICESVETDFGYSPSDLGTVGDLVWYDTDGEGDQDEWWDANDDSLITQNFPDVNGNILWDDYEWFDVNGSGTYDLPEDEGELRKCGIDNVPVTLDSPGKTRMTDLFGYYRFYELPVGSTYTTSIDSVAPELLAASEEIFFSGLCKTQSDTLATAAALAPQPQADLLCGLTTTNSHTSKVLLTPPPPGANIDLSLDYGISCSDAGDRVAIGNMVWADNGNGNDAFKNDAMRNNGEAGINGVIVELYRDVDGDGACEPGGDDGAALATTTTADGGFYQFLYRDPSIGGDPMTNYCVAVVTSSVSALGFTQSSSGGEHNPDMSGDQDVPDGDDGVPGAAHVISRPFPVTVNGQTTDDSDDPAGYVDDSAYMTVDFGFFSGGSTAVNLKAFGVEQSLPAGLLVLAAALLLTALFFVRRRATSAG